MAGYFTTPNKANTSMGRGRQIDYAIDDASGWLQQGVAGFKTKAKSGGETIFLPIFPGAIRTPDGEDTDYFRSVVVGEFGLDRNFTSFIANPIDRECEFKEIPVIALNREFSSGIERNDPAYLPAMPFFMPRGQYKQPDFRWPQTWVVFQCAVYRQPCLGEMKALESLKNKVKMLQGPLLADGVTRGPGLWVFAEPEFKLMFIKGTGRDAVSRILHSVDTAGNFQVPLEAFAGGSPTCFQTSTIRDKDDKPNMDCGLFDLVAAGLRPPTREEVVQHWVPWEKCFRKISYAEQMSKCVRYFGLGLVSQVFPEAASLTGHSQGMSPAQPAQQPATGGAAAAPSAWGTPQAPQQQAQAPAQAPAAPAPAPAAAPAVAPSAWGAPPAQPPPAAVRTFQQSAAVPPGATPAPGVPAAPVAPPQQPAAAPSAWGAPPAAPAAVVPPAQPAAAAAAPPVTAQPASTVAMTPAEMAARFSAYRNPDGSSAPAPAAK